MKKILTSACLYGDIVRYDGKGKALNDPTYLKWKDEGRLVVICPEVFGGLPTPRHPCERQGDKLISDIGVDCTEEYMAGALEAVRLAKANDVVCCIMKQSSPSCGSSNIYDGTFGGVKIAGQGLTVELLREAGFKVFDENEVTEAALLLEALEK